MSSHTFGGMSVIEAQPTSSLATALITGAAIGFVVIFTIVSAALLLAGAGLGPSRRRAVRRCLRWPRIRDHVRRELVRPPQRRLGLRSVARL
jgi:hypothetical protein